MCGSIGRDGEKWKKHEEGVLFYLLRAGLFGVGWVCVGGGDCEGGCVVMAMRSSLC